MTREKSGFEGQESTNGTPTAGLLPSKGVCPGFVFDALSAERRRTLCRVLDQNDGRDLKDLAMDIAAVEHGTDGSEGSNYEWESVYASLYHQHVPKLETLDVVAFDRDTNTVEPGERFDAVDAALEAVETALDGWALGGRSDG
ncbi:hypothetical protein ACFQFH_00990 [Halobaculum halobium]|uniref:DUF7344 domain-containing protein n=1 Tax=Halobaculum halobium TaxID=3032281 RepID=A0ABD5T5J9_9EURY|nr:hypothetical protein [Halobaculum sp. SYNS20]